MISSTYKFWGRSCRDSLPKGAVATANGRNFPFKINMVANGTHILFSFKMTDIYSKIYPVDFINLFSPILVFLYYINPLSPLNKQRFC